MRRIIHTGFLVVLLSSPAAAQVVTALDPSETYIPIMQFATGPTLCFSDGFCVTERQGIPLGTFATTTQLNALSTRVDNALTTLAGIAPQLRAFDAQLTSLASQVATINSSLASIDSRLEGIDDDLSRALEGTAVAAALKDALPNPGDRFALRVNAAGLNGEFAGALGFSANVAEKTRVLFNYGRGRTQNAVSGGVNFSFR